MTYAPKTWADGPTGGTPINAAALNHMEQGIADAVPAGGQTLRVVVEHTGDAARKVGPGAHLVGVPMPAGTLSRHRVLLGTADASGSTIVELRKNGTAIPGATVTVTAPATMAEVTGTWTVAADDVVQPYVTQVGATPGKGMVSVVTGVC
ncbi:hypothetical protein G4X40_16805 [Rhodococcus sp. D2-41]|uniref:hypothetical protein n=1 Tax=Speluncibacter jeojiensis TaxID=2710754 RepID=UPI0024109735|nr:hypothetical protein [Rhodococcus sp. D2-41]MDG3011807.1 hypothetical protein [Rhodococcus sp. D2-41]